MPCPFQPEFAGGVDPQCAKKMSGSEDQLWASFHFYFENLKLKLSLFQEEITNIFCEGLDNFGYCGSWISA